MPITAGFAGAAFGFELIEGASTPPDVGSHVRYLSGLLLGIGLGYLSTIPRIENQGVPFRLLTAIVVIGGLCRLLGFMVLGLPSLVMLGALAMELVVTPALCLWRERVERRWREK